jgi:hypothetical protein
VLWVVALRRWSLNKGMPKAPTKAPGLRPAATAFRQQDRGLRRNRKIEESIGFPANPVFNNKLLRHGSPGQSFAPERDDTRRLIVIVVT